MIHLIAMNLAIASAMLAGLLLPAAAAWTLASLLATFIYLAVVGIELTLMERERLEVPTTTSCSPESRATSCPDQN